MCGVAESWPECAAGSGSWGGRRRRCPGRVGGQVAVRPTVTQRGDIGRGPRESKIRRPAGVRWIRAPGIEAPRSGLARERLAGRWRCWRQNFPGRSRKIRIGVAVGPGCLLGAGRHSLPGSVSATGYCWCGHGRGSRPGGRRLQACHHLDSLHLKRVGGLGAQAPEVGLEAGGGLGAQFPMLAAPSPWLGGSGGVDRSQRTGSLRNSARPPPDAVVAD